MNNKSKKIDGGARRATRRVGRGQTDMQRLFGVVDLPTVVQPEDLISDDVPDGHQTVAGWWATKEKEALEMLSDPIATIFADEEEIITLADQHGILWKWCSSPPALRRLGFTTGKAFPVELLHQFYPLNP